ncbi:MAG: OsmC family protein [Verrucomicrobiota bacterium]
MSEHRTTLTWQRGDTGFGYKEFTRAHSWQFPKSGQSLAASAAVDYLGDADAVDPEEAYTASLASCHMLTFLAIASISGYVVDRYADEAVGFLEKGENGKPWLARVKLNPTVEFSGEKQPDADALEKLHHKAHQECFLANSVKTVVEW